MSVEQLEYFIESIKSLEQEFEVTLLDRSNRGIELTESGEFFLKESVQILEYYEKCKKIT